MAIKTQEKVRCDECDEEGAIGNMYKVELWDRPFDESPRIAYFHKKIPAKLKGESPYKWHESCDELIYERGDFNYFVCTGCERIVCEQNPSNGWQVQYRTIGGKQFCLKCYREEILENGVGREGFEEGHLEGMFFNSGNPEPLEAGYVVDERVHNKRVVDGKEVCKIALDYIDNGQKVIIGYESMAIGGLEGYVTLFHKEAK
jgi:hypothetical protein